MLTNAFSRPTLTIANNNVHTINNKELLISFTYYFLDDVRVEIEALQPGSNIGSCPEAYWVQFSEHERRH
jgi:hypothetical protein